MQGLNEMLLQERSRLLKIMRIAEDGLEEVPEGTLRISKDRGQVRYYQCINDSYGKYIPMNNADLPRQLAQKKYNENVANTARKRLKQIEKLLKGYSDDEIEELYSSLHPDRQKLIRPVEPTMEQKIKAWYEAPFTGKSFDEAVPVILTEDGKRVRSKSEKILADFFYREKIPYLYEKPLQLKGYGLIYPDFTFFSRKTGQEIYWEHEGMMDKPEYSRTAIKKINLYQQNNIFIGERLIMTFETEQDIINTKIIEKLTEKYLL